MHGSTIYTLARSPGADRLDLPPEASEWLFASGFWQRVNSQLGTIFDQYEEDAVSPEVLARVSPFLRETIAEVGALRVEQIKFVRGWDANGNAIVAHVGKGALLADLIRLSEKVESACADARTLVFVL